MNRNEIYALSRIKGIGPKAISTILDYLEASSIDSIKDVDLALLLNDKKLSRYKNIIAENLSWDTFEKHIRIAKNKINEIEEKNISVVCITDQNYPPLLKLTVDAPVFLYCKGNLSLLTSSNNVAVVGTRNNTSYGKLITEKTVQFLCLNEYTIVSGLALGIDTIAHQEALNVNGKTISVLVDVDNIQPSSNRELAEKILEQEGLLISEEPPGTRILPSLFAKRDRIQSGLSLAVFAIETSIDGGTMHAVKNAEKENRLLFVPNIDQVGYKDMSIEQLEGIKYLIEENKAVPYTKNNYPKVLKKLKGMPRKLLQTQALF
jgi:DNA processing protein